jgi:membrane complex biogenesis BtpA family protein
MRESSTRADWLEASPVIGVLHVPALPGAPRNRLPYTSILEWVLDDLSAYAEGGADAVILENYGDVPFYPERVPAETVAYLTAIAVEVRRRSTLPLGVNVLRNDGESALAIAAACGAAFVRVNVYTGARVADQGLLQGHAERIQRLRRTLDARVMVFADVAVKHSAPLGERALEDEVADTLQRGLAEAVIVTGAGTGQATSLDALRTARVAAQGAPVLCGSGATEESVAEILQTASGVIVGTALKHGGVTANAVDAERVRRFVAAARG